MLLSIGMIVKNEEKGLRACLEGIKPILEQVDAELVVADTGSSDGTAAIAGEFTENVFGVEWKGSFAEARNFTLEKAKGQWYMFLDADEVFGDVSEIVEFFNSGEHKKYRSASHYMENAGAQGRDVFTRLYKIEKATAFKGKIHEQIPLQPPVKRLGSCSVHTGYDFGGEEGRAKRAAKHARNIAPLLEAHGEAPEDIRVIAQIAGEYLSAEKLGEALEFIGRGLKLRGKGSGDMFYHVLRSYEAICLCKEKNWEKAAERAGEYFAAAGKLFVCSINTRLAQALALEELKRDRDAARAYGEALKLLEALESGRLDEEDVLMSVTASPAPGAYCLAAGKMAALYAGMGEFEGFAREESKRPGRLFGADNFFRRAAEAYDRKNAGDMHGFLALMREGVIILPAMGEAVKKAIKAAENEKLDIKAKLDRETAAIKEVVYGFVEKGQTAAARSVLERYAQINPSDADIKIIGDIAQRAEEDPSLPGEIALMRGVTAVFVLSNIIAGGSGVINSVLRKARLMEECWGCRPVLLTCGHNIELRRILKALKTQGESAGGGRKAGIGKNTRAISVYERLQNSYADGLENKAVFLNPDDGADRAETEKDIYDVYEGGKLARKEYYTGDGGSLRAVMRVENGRNADLTFYDDWGYVNKVCRYAQGEDAGLDSVEFYSTGGWVCAKASYSRENGENVLEKISVYGQNGSATGEFKDDAGLAAMCLNEILDGESPCLIVVEDGLMTPDIERVQKRGATKAIVVHTIFQEDPYDPKSGPNAHYRHMCENPAAFDGIVFVTGAEREDFCRRYGHRGRTFVIPHPYPYEIERAGFDGRGHRKAVMVTRFDAVKQIGLAIDIFAMAAKKLPDIRLEIYGFGAEKEKCLNQIKRLGMEENIFIMGATDDPAAVFGGAAASMMTSMAEGFGIAMAESVCCGCPVFAFDVKYGPSDIVRDGKTGFLFKPFVKEPFAEKLVEYFEDAGLQKAMSENAYGDAPRFGKAAFLAGWRGLTESVRRQ